MASARPTWRDWVPLAAIVLTMVSGFLIAGGYLDRISQLERRDTAIEARLDRQDGKLDEIKATTNRTEGTLEALRDKHGSLQ